MLLTQFQAMLQFYVNMFFFEWAKISIFNILYIFYKIVGDRNFGFITKEKVGGDIANPVSQDL